MAKNPLIERLERLDTIPSNFVSEAEKAQSAIFKGILKKLDKLQLDEDGRILLNKSNLAQIQDLGDELNELMIGKNTKYYNAVKDFVKEIDVQKGLNQEYFADNFDFKNDPTYDELSKISQQRAIDNLANTAATQNVEAFKDMLQTSIASKDKFTSFIDNVKTQIEGNDQIDGGLVRYARQNASDLYAIADREYVNAISDELGVEFYEYSGGKMPTSRPFCIERNGKIFHKKEIEAWGNGKKTEGMQWPKSGTWAGMARSTDGSSIFNLLGGYSCNHVLVPVNIKYVPVSVLQRNIDAGNIKKEDLPPNIQAKL